MAVLESEFAAPRSALISLALATTFLIGVWLLGDLGWFDFGVALLIGNYAIHCLEPPGKSYPGIQPKELPLALGIVGLLVLLHLADPKVALAFAVMVLLVGTVGHAGVVYRNHKRNL